MSQTNERRRFRAIFVSDVHLGTRGCKAELLLDFLRHVHCDQLYLVGDIVDGWRLRRSWHWPDAHDAVVHEVLRLARGGTRVTYVPGNHDECLRRFAGQRHAGVDLALEAEHVTADGRRLLVLHGDVFDEIVQGARWLAHLGDFGYEVAVVVGQVVHRLRHRMGRPYWSLAGWLKRRVKGAVAYVDSFERAAVTEARRRGYDGVVTGHLHTPSVRDFDGVLYVNDGDWVDSCTALVEHDDGRLELLDWLSERSSEIVLAGSSWVVAAPAEPTAA
jgi:UDP-2,3-diacylglucosamine pyrophosphatase LpxH